MLLWHCFFLDFMLYRFHLIKYAERHHYVKEKGQGKMKFYKPEELRAGMRLAKQIYNKQGVLLYERGLVLNDQIIASVQKFGLLGVLILEPAEPLPPISAEEQEFEQLQTAYMFRLRDSMISISKGQPAEDLPVLVSDIAGRFGSINHPVDRDPCCGYTGIIDNECPMCHRKEGEGDVGFERIRRITGYLVGTIDRFNNAKRAEVNDRVKHGV